MKTGQNLTKKILFLITLIKIMIKIGDVLNTDSGGNRIDRVIYLTILLFLLTFQKKFDIIHQCLCQIHGRQTLSMSKEK